MLETVLLLIVGLVLVNYGINRRKQRTLYKDRHGKKLICVISFYDRSKTLPTMEAFFEQERIVTQEVKREIKRVDGTDVFTNTYQISMPDHADQGKLVEYLCAIETVRSVQIRPI